MKYYLCLFNYEPIEVTKEEYKIAEEKAGLSGESMYEPFTSCFSNSMYHGYILDENGKRPAHLKDVCVITPNSRELPGAP